MPRPSLCIYHTFHIASVSMCTSISDRHTFASLYPESCSCCPPSVESNRVMHHAASYQLRVLGPVLLSIPDLYDESCCCFFFNDSHRPVAPALSGLHGSRSAGRRQHVPGQLQSTEKRQVPKWYECKRQKINKAICKYTKSDCIDKYFAKVNIQFRSLPNEASC